ncbi:MAG: hypothetical protein L0Z62_09240, partial [Gemmataceae bacterium]|nr:hypothetical protein [Gemmataceae bacterium]
VCVGWNEGWVIYRYSLDKGQWLMSKSPPARLSGAFIGVGSRTVVVLNRGRKFSGWLLDLQSHKWKELPESPVGAKPTWISGGVAAVVDHRLIVWGDTKIAPYGAVLDTVTLKWSAIPDGPVAPRKRCPHAVIGKKLFVWGGYGPGFDPKEPDARGPLSDGAVYDLERKEWDDMPRAPIQFKYGIAWGVWRDRFVLVGGKGQRGGAIYYDSPKRSWEKIPDAPFDVGINSACAISGDRLFVWSGAQKAAPNGAVYDFRKREWKKIAQAPIPPRQLAFAHAVGNRVVVWGGWVSDRDPGRFLRDGAIYDLDKGTWQKIPDLPGDVPFSLHPGW